MSLALRRDSERAPFVCLRVSCLVLVDNVNGRHEVSYCK